MAADLAGEPRTGLEVQLCGDAHLSNFGAFAAPDRRLVFSINDFDETLPGRFEWDVKRQVASFAVAGRDRGFDARQRETINRTVARSYREAITAFAAMSNLDLWYAAIDVEQIAAFTRVRPQSSLPVPRGPARSTRTSPFHEDQRASLHAVPAPARGWCCYSCGRGGSIYHLAGPLWGLATRSREFVQLRELLLERFEIASWALGSDRNSVGAWPRVGDGHHVHMAHVRGARRQSSDHVSRRNVSVPASRARRDGQAVYLSRRRAFMSRGPRRLVDQAA